MNNNKRNPSRRAEDKPTPFIDHVATCALLLAFGLFFATIVIFDEATIWKTTSEFMAGVVR